MAEVPKINDFLDRLRVAAKEVKVDLASDLMQLEFAAVRSGAYDGSRFILQMLDKIRGALKGHARTAFADAHLVASDSGLPSATLRDLTSQHLTGLASEIRATMAKFEPRHGDLISRGFDEVAEYFTYLRRQFDIGRANRGLAQMSSSNVINATTVIGVQQGTSGSTQTLNISIDRPALTEAVAALAREVDRLPPEVPTIDIRADLDSLRAQLSKGAASEAVLRELGRSLRSGVESVAANAATPGLLEAAASLVAALGLS